METSKDRVFRFESGFFVLRPGTGSSVSLTHRFSFSVRYQEVNGVTTYPTRHSWPRRVRGGTSQWVRSGCHHRCTTLVPQEISTGWICSGVDRRGRGLCLGFRSQTPFVNTGNTGLDGENPEREGLSPWLFRTHRFLWTYGWEDERQRERLGSRSLRGLRVVH